MGVSLRQHARGHLVCLGPDGEVKWEDWLDSNIWHDEGEQQLLYAAFATGQALWQVEANYYFGLDARGAPAEADTLASLSNEESGNGYARQAVSTAGDGTGGQDWVVSQPVAAYQVASKTVTFGPASGSDWSAKTQLFLCTHLTATTSGDGQRLLCTLALSTSRTLTVGDSLQADMTIGISE